MTCPSGTMARGRAGLFDPHADGQWCPSKIQRHAGMASPAMARAALSYQSDEITIQGQTLVRTPSSMLAFAAIEAIAGRPRPMSPISWPTSAGAATYVVARSNAASRPAVRVPGWRFLYLRSWPESIGKTTKAKGKVIETAWICLVFAGTSSGCRRTGQPGSMPRPISAFPMIVSGGAGTRMRTRFS